MLYPLTFKPLFKERLWGGRKLESLYAKALPSNLPIGESWEISDRPGDASVVAAGPLAGKDLHWIVENCSRDLLGNVAAQKGRFPLLVKILDAEQTLSLQVHPPPDIAAQLQGEPKTELWYLAQAAPDAELLVGLRRGIDKLGFVERLQTGMVADCFHRIRVSAGDAMFVPSGRVHGIGAGCVIFEVQQNSDTTYRVFDWNRVDREGKPRDLHVEASMQSIDFNDIEPQLIQAPWLGEPMRQSRTLVRCPWFDVEEKRLGLGLAAEMAGGVAILGVARGELVIEDARHPVRLRSGSFCLLPACVAGVVARATEATEFLEIRPK